MPFRRCWALVLQWRRHPPQALAGYAALAGSYAQQALPAGFAQLEAGGLRGGAAAAQPVVLPLPSATGGTARSKNGEKKQIGGSSGRGNAPPQPPSNRVLSAIARSNSVMQEERQQFQQVQGGPTCDKYTAA